MIYCAYAEKRVTRAPRRGGGAGNGMQFRLRQRSKREFIFASIRKRMRRKFVLGRCVVVGASFPRSSRAEFAFKQQKINTGFASRSKNRRYINALFLNVQVTQLVGGRGNRTLVTVTWLGALSAIALLVRSRRFSALIYESTHSVFVR